MRKTQNILSKLHLAPCFALGLLVLTGCGVGMSKQSAGITTVATPVSASVQVQLTGQTQVRLGLQAQLTAQVTGSSDTQVIWQVNGVTGGSSAVGIISSTGLYTPPATIPAGGTVTIAAVSVAQTSASASLVETILNPGVVVTSAVATLLNNTSISLEVQGSGFIAGTIVKMNGTAIATTVVSSTKLTSSATIAQGAKSVAVIVVNPDPGSTSSPSLSVTIPAGSTVLQVKLSGQTQVRLGSQVAFTAQVTGSSDNQVIWQVNSITGGNGTVGAISSSGVYTPPPAIPTGGSVTVSAYSVAQASASASMVETILNPVVAIASATATPVSNVGITLEVVGSGFVAGATMSVDGTTVSTSLVSSTELMGSATIAQGSTSVTVVVTNPDPGSTSSAATDVMIPHAAATAISAARILDQTSFGPTAATITQVEQEGLAAYLQGQLQQPASLIEISLPPNVPKDSLPAYCLRSAQDCVNFAWWNNVINGPDQLRQRVAFALSQIFVTSEDEVWFGAFPYYVNLLSQDSFSNWSTTMHDVTLSPAMGVYLNMMNSIKAPAGQIPNENFAREFMQLFSIGIDQLNIDGTPILDSNGNPVPNYTEAQVEAFARAYTGWTSSTSDGSIPTAAVGLSHLIYTAPMVAVERNHDTSQKILLNGTVLPAGQTAEQDLQDALDNIFNDSSLPPFVCKQLIQHLVTSNPSPEYISRVAQVFVNDGKGVRGNMTAVLTAIFMDSEARAGDSGASSQSFGHLREPILWLSAATRGLEATESTGDASSYQGIDTAAGLLSQPVLDPPSVFNFYAPGGMLPGSTVLAPEFGLENTASIMQKLNITDEMVFNAMGNDMVDLSATSTLGKLAASSPELLLDQLNLIFLHGNMSTDMRAVILDAISGITDPAQQVRIAVYLVLTSPQFKIIS